MTLTSTPHLYCSPPEIPAVNDPKLRQSFPRHPIEAPELTMTRTFFPMGFSVQVRTNEVEVFSILDRMWGRFEQSSQSSPLPFDVYVVDADNGQDCPPAPVYRFIPPLLMGVADAENYSAVDLVTPRSQVSIARSTLAYPLYAEWFLLSAPLAAICTGLATPIHAACISRAGHGVLLCGESGAGKSTLAYACARAGWTFTSDDATLVPHAERGRRVIGNCHQLRLRPSAAELFPEIAGRDITPRAAGKPSIEVPTAELPHISTAFSTVVQSIVFLDRCRVRRPMVDRFPLPAARSYLRGALFGLPETLGMQYEVLDRMLSCPVRRLRYERLDHAIELLDRLVERGEA